MKLFCKKAYIYLILISCCIGVTGCSNSSDSLATTEKQEEMQYKESLSLFNMAKKLGGSLSWMVYLEETSFDQIDGYIINYLQKWNLQIGVNPKKKVFVAFEDGANRLEYALASCYAAVARFSRSNHQVKQSSVVHEISYGGIIGGVNVRGEVILTRPDSIEIEATEIENIWLTYGESVWSIKSVIDENNFQIEVSDTPSWEELLKFIGLRTDTHVMLINDAFHNWFYVILIVKI
jgi:hypothetical protein